MCRLNRTVGNTRIDTVRPRIAVCKDNDRQLQFIVDAVQKPPRRARGLSFQVHEDCIILLIKTVLHQTRIHTAGLHRNHKLCVVLHEFNVLDVIRNRIPRLPHILLTVQNLLAAAGVLLNPERTVY